VLAPISRSTFLENLLCLLKEGAITDKDLEVFSEDTQEYIRVIRG